MKASRRLLFLRWLAAGADDEAPDARRLFSAIAARSRSDRPAARGMSPRSAPRHGSGRREQNDAGYETCTEYGVGCGLRGTVQPEDPKRIIRLKVYRVWVDPGFHGAQALGDGRFKSERVLVGSRCSLNCRGGFLNFGARPSDAKLISWRLWWSAGWVSCATDVVRQTPVV